MIETNNQLLREIRDGSGGGGGSTTASNGLTKIGDDIALGGALEVDTTVHGDATYSFFLLNRPIADVGTAEVTGVALAPGGTMTLLAYSADGTESSTVTLDNGTFVYKKDNATVATFTAAGLELEQDASVTIKSPDGTRYELVVADGGALSTVAV